MRRYLLITVLIQCILLPTVTKAQSRDDVRDTLRSSRIVADKAAARDAGTRIADLSGLRSMVSATGESDIVKYLQTLPGVATGAEGSSAIYVRGGTLGGNLTTLDGVTVYGGSHLLGMSSVCPMDIISSAGFRVGGFHGDETNITASHIMLRTVDGDFKAKDHNISISPFMLGGVVSMPLIPEKVSFVGSVRVSPLGPLFRAVQSAAGGELDSLDRPRAVVYDVFAKAQWLVDRSNTISLSAFNSKDGYSYCYGGDSDESMGWDNLILNLRHEGRLDHGWSIEDGAAYNRFSGRQGVIRDMSGTVNNIAIVSSLDELTADAVLSRPIGRLGDVRLGARERLALFNPGTSSTFKGSGPLRPLDSPRTDHKSHASITTFHAQWDVSVGERLSLMASGKFNVYAADESGSPVWRWRSDPEAGMSAQLNITDWLAAEATADWAVQYYHTLEGVPMGWSLDLLVPTAANRPPEKSRQYYAGLSMSSGMHHITLGAYDKSMSGLVYFADASLLFSPAIAGWSNNIMVGTGTSRGVELLYEKQGERLSWHAAYTYSKTDRTFAGVNDGLTFPAKFDRRHILTATASLTVMDMPRWSAALTGLYTFQSGHRETVAGCVYPAISIMGDEYSMDYYTSVNNYEMPAYIRLDLGCSLKFRTAHPQELNLGVYNVMNRHNPFSVVYDDRSREWRQISLLPVMPSINYHIMF